MELNGQAHCECPLPDCDEKNKTKVSLHKSDPHSTPTLVMKIYFLIIHMDMFVGRYVVLMGSPTLTNAS